MPKAEPAAAEEQRFLITALSPGPAQKRLALAVVVAVMLAAFLIMGPLSGIQFRANRTFVAAYVAAMLVTDAITAVLLYAQFTIVRSLAILVVASGYLFCALIVLMYFFAFPGLVPAEAAFGGLQTAPWLYVTWHSGFGLFVIAYALTKDREPVKWVFRGKAGAAILRSIALTFVAAATAGYIAATQEANLPRIVLDAVRFSPDWPLLVAVPITLPCAVGAILLWLRRRSVLDLWLMVVMFLFIVEQPLSRYPLPMRFGIGWYSVRVIGFLASSVVLVVLLYEITTLYPRLLGAVLAQRRERHARLATGDAVAASIVHEIRQPLTAMVTTADAGLRFLDREEPNVEKAKEAFKRISEDGYRAGSLVLAIRANFKSDVGERAPFDPNDLIEEVLALDALDLEKHGILVRTEPNPQIPPVRGNRLQVQQVLVNLIANAVDAMVDRDDPRVLTVRSDLDAEGQVLISVADTGVGVPPVDAHRVFGPLFTTKPDGMGMGLSICRAIVEAHEGRLWFTKNEPRGTVFQFTLQANAPAAA